MNTVDLSSKETRTHQSALRNTRSAISLCLSKIYQLEYEVAQIEADAEGIQKRIASSIGEDLYHLGNVLGSVDDQLGPVAEFLSGRALPEVQEGGAA